MFKLSGMSRTYQLGRRQASVDRTSERILAAAQAELERGSALSVGAVARAAGVTRATVYNRVGSRSELLRRLAPAPAPATTDVEGFLAARTGRWAANPALYRHLPEADETETTRRLAEDLARLDLLRPGCSIKEAHDVLAALGSFPVFDRLHQDGRRTTAAVAEILMRLARGILA